MPAFIGGFRLLKEIGRGGMGVVYLAENVTIRRRVAVKMLHPSLAQDELLLQRFVTEAQAVAALQHPHIVQLIDLAQLPDSRLYMILEYVEGTTLSRMLNGNALPVSYALSLLLQICSALAAAHAKGIVHRDIKPENVIVLNGVSQEPFAKLLDFGIAKFVSEVEPGSPGLVVGTPSYISPEQLTAQPVDHRADLYSLGVLAYLLFSGRLPFQGDMANVLYQHVHSEPDPISSIPPKLWKALRKALAKRPEDRFASAEAFAAALRDGARQQDELPPFTALLVGRELLVRFHSAEAWERARTTELANKRFYVPDPTLPDGPLNVTFELFGAPVLRAEASVSARVPAEQAAAWGLAAGCAVVLRQAQTPEAPGAMQPADTNPGGATLASVGEFLVRAGGDHYQFLQLPREADGASILACCEWLQAQLVSLRSTAGAAAGSINALHVRLQRARRDLVDPERRATYDAELGNHRGTAAAIREGLPLERLAELRAAYAARHPERIARAETARMELELMPTSPADQQRLLELALTHDPLSGELHRQLWKLLRNRQQHPMPFRSTTVGAP